MFETNRFLALNSKIREMANLTFWSISYYFSQSQYFWGKIKVFKIPFLFLRYHLVNEISIWRVSSLIWKSYDRSKMYSFILWHKGSYDMKMLSRKFVTRFFSNMAQITPTHCRSKMCNKRKLRHFVNKLYYIQDRCAQFKISIKGENPFLPGGLPCILK